MLRIPGGSERCTRAFGTPQDELYILQRSSSGCSHGCLSYNFPAAQANKFQRDNATQVRKERVPTPPRAHSAFFLSLRGGFVGALLAH